MIDRNPNVPQLSIILPTDSFETIQAVLERLRKQTIARQLEVVLVAPVSVDMTKARALDSEFAAVRIVEIQSLSPLGTARAAGVRAASARLIFVGETHSYLHPDAAAKLIAAATKGDWAAVAPGFENANRKSLFSWAGFLADYARWSAALPAGEIAEVPLYNALYRRDVLLGLGDRLDTMLSHGDELRIALQAGGHRVYFEPSARIDHVNLDAPLACLHEQFLAGRMIGGQRARRWSWWQRLGYALGSFLIPVVLFRRVLGGALKTTRSESVPKAAIPAILLLTFAKAAGELMSYVAGGNAAQDLEMDRYEIRKLDYLA